MWILRNLEQDMFQCSFRTYTLLKNNNSSSRKLIHFQKQIPQIYRKHYLWHAPTSITQGF